MTTAGEDRCFQRELESLDEKFNSTKRECERYIATALTEVSGKEIKLTLSLPDPSEVSSSDECGEREKPRFENRLLLAAKESESEPEVETGLLALTLESDQMVSGASAAQIDAGVEGLQSAQAVRTPRKETVKKKGSEKGNLTQRIVFLNEVIECQNEEIADLKQRLCKKQPRANLNESVEELERKLAEREGTIKDLGKQIGTLQTNLSYVVGCVKQGKSITTSEGALRLPSAPPCLVSDDYTLTKLADLSGAHAELVAATNQAAARIKRLYPEISKCQDETVRDFLGMSPNPFVTSVILEASKHKTEQLQKIFHLTETNRKLESKLQELKNKHEVLKKSLKDKWCKETGGKRTVLLVEESASAETTAEDRPSLRLITPDAKESQQLRRCLNALDNLYRHESKHWKAVFAEKLSKDQKLATHLLNSHICFAHKASYVSAEETLHILRQSIVSYWSNYARDSYKADLLQLVEIAQSFVRSEKEAITRLAVEHETLREDHSRQLKSETTVNEKLLRAEGACSFVESVASCLHRLCPPDRKLIAGIMTTHEVALLI